MDIALTPQDCKEVLVNYPSLNCSLKRGVVWGALEFSCCYDSDKQEIIHDLSLGNQISDSYEIRIDLIHKDRFGFPTVYEDSEIIKNFAISTGVQLRDLHINKEEADSCCLGIFPEYNWKGVSNFIRDKITPFFYWQSYRRIHGKEPWSAHLHGDAGIIESMRHPPKEVGNNGNRNKPCPCGSGLKYKKCCFFRDSILKNELARRSRLAAKQGKSS